jgi:hypothetical protein
VGGGEGGGGWIMRCCRVLQGILEVLRHGHALFTAGFNPTKVLLTYTVQALYCWGEGMGLLEYRAMPSLRDVAHDDVCAHSGGMDLHHVQNHTLLGHSPPAKQAGRRVGAAL